MPRAMPCLNGWSAPTPSSSLWRCSPCLRWVDSRHWPNPNLPAFGSFLVPLATADSISLVACATGVLPAACLPKAATMAAIQKGALLIAAFLFDAPRSSLTRSAPVEIATA